MISNNLFRVVWFDTQDDNKWSTDTEHIFECIADRNSAWKLWFTLSKKLEAKHVAVFNMDGVKCEPEKGLSEMIGTTPGWK